MALNFGILDLDAPAKIAGSVYAGQQARQEQQDRNMLRQQQAEQIEIQRQNMLGLREDRLAQAQQRKSELARATESQQWLNKVAELWDPNIPLNSQTAAQGLQYALKSGDRNAIEMMQKTVQAFRDEEQFNTEMGRFGFGAPSTAATAPATTTEPFVGELPTTLGVTSSPVALRGMPAPVALPTPGFSPAVPSSIRQPPAVANALNVGGQSIDRNMLAQMAMSPNKAVRDRAASLEKLLPKEDSRYNVPGVGLVDAAGKVIVSSTSTPKNIANINPNDFTPASIQKFSQSGNYADLVSKKPVGTGEGAATKAPAGYRYTKTGDLEAIPGGPAAASESLSPKEIQKREAALPQARQSVKSVSNTMSVIGQTVDSLLANPDGINGITGLVYGITPAITGPARKAKAELDQLKNLAFIQGITELRAASKTGAAVGNVSNREGDRFENLKASLDRQQDKDDLIAALKKLKQQAELTSQFMSEAFDETYSYKSGGTSAPAAAPGKPAVPSVGTIQDGYRFKGGNPADKANWEKQ